MAMSAPGTNPPTEADFLRLFVKHEEALRAFARVLLPSWEAVDDVEKELAQGGRTRPKLLIRLNAAWVLGFRASAVVIPNLPGNPHMA